MLFAFLQLTGSDSNHHTVKIRFGWEVLHVENHGGFSLYFSDNLRNYDYPADIPLVPFSLQVPVQNRTLDLIGRSQDRQIFQ